MLEKEPFFLRLFLMAVLVKQCLVLLAAFGNLNDSTYERSS